MLKSILAKFRKTSETAPATQVPPMAPPDPVDQLYDIKDMLWDPTRRFSMTAVMETLDQIQKTLAAENRTDPEAQGLLAYSQGYIHSKRDDSVDAIDAYRTALHCDAQAPFLTERQSLSARLGVAIGHEKLAQKEEAIAAFKNVMPDMLASDHYTPDQVGGVMERIGYMLHEMGDYQAAHDQNQALLEFAEDFVEDDSIALCTVLTNLAQNQYELGQFENTHATLARCLNIATLHDDAERVVDMRFQLGVLAHEQGNNAQARDHMEKGLAYAKSAKDEWLINRAQTHLDELAERIAGTPPPQ